MHKLWWPSLLRISYIRENVGNLNVTLILTFLRHSMYYIRQWSLILQFQNPEIPQNIFGTDPVRFIMQYCIWYKLLSVYRILKYLAPRSSVKGLGIWTSLWVMLYNFKSNFILILCFSCHPCEIYKVDIFGECWALE